MSLHFTITPHDGSVPTEIFVVDNPQIMTFYYPYSTTRIRNLPGFSYQFPTVITLPPGSFAMWYRFTVHGMYLGYYCNPSNLSVEVPNDSYIYLRITNFNFSHYQMKVYIDCMDFKMFLDTDFPYVWDFTQAPVDDSVKRIKQLRKLRTLEYKAFKELSVASFVCLPYTMFSTYKFDFEHTMYNSDGSLKPEAKYYPSMFADGGELRPQFFPQPSTITN